ncbi:MAG: recombinase family protein [Clostridia bacterium]
MKAKSTYKAALYMRLSKDDDGGIESASISTQRKMLMSYAAENGYAIYDEYVDDGWSGTNFDRPGFKRMISDVEAKKVDLIITKDLSRLGRDYIMAGQYTEIYFPSKGVRCIAINDGYDSDSTYTDIAPFRNVINEMYARDTSKKIRSAFVTRMRDGAYIGAFAPYGYRKDPADKHRLLVDEQSSVIVKKIFAMAACGSLPIQIARRMNAQGIPSPAVYRCMTNEKLDINTYSKRLEWTSATITKMLSNVVYLGHIAQGKTTKVSFKSHLTVKNPRDEWIVVKNTHEALVDEEVFDLVRRRAMARTCVKKGEFNNLFSGIAKCADCGHNMSATGSRKKGSTVNLVCGSYKLYGSGECSNHFIDYNVLYRIVMASLREQLTIIREEQDIIHDVAKKKQLMWVDKQDKSKALNAAKKRMRELDSIIKKLYEDNANGSLGDARMNKLLLKYEHEAQMLEQNIAGMNKVNDGPEVVEKAVNERLRLALRQIIDVNELTTNMLFKLIDHIEIAQGHYESGEHGRTKRQTVRIFYRFKTVVASTEYVM